MRYVYHIPDGNKLRVWFGRDEYTHTIYPTIETNLRTVTPSTQARISRLLTCPSVKHERMFAGYYVSHVPNKQPSAHQKASALKAAENAVRLHSYRIARWAQSDEFGTEFAPDSVKFEGHGKDAKPKQL